MSRVAAVLEPEVDLRLGQMAVQAGLLSPEHLEVALQEQARGVQRGRKKPRRLGVILAEKKFLSDTVILRLLEEQEALLLVRERRRREDALLGRILVDADLAPATRVEECLALQEQALRAGAEKPQPLGDLLVARGYATKEDVGCALELQARTRLSCGTCRTEYGTDEIFRAALDECPSCRGALEVLLPPEKAAPSTPVPPEKPLDFGRYQVLRQVGQGAMGAVYEALDGELERKVALKVIRRDLKPGEKAKPDEVERFVREARLAAQLPRHPNIVSVYESGEESGRRYIAMEFVEGRTFAEWRQTSAVPLRKQVRILRDVALAVEHAHRHNVLHRDLKPGNILIDAQERPYVADFGLARSVNEEDHSGLISGTPDYMSPEQARGLPDLDGRCDVFALGAMLYEILSERPPFKGRTREETLRKLLSGESIPPPGRLSRFRPFSTVDSEIEDISLRALSPERSGRTPTARAFAEELDRWLLEKEKAARLALKSSWIPGGRKLWIAAGAVGLVSLLLGAFVVRAASSFPADRDLRRAESSARAGREEEALGLYGGILRQDPGHLAARAGRDSLLLRLVSDTVRDTDKAQAALEQARLDLSRCAGRLKEATLANEGRLRDELAEAESRVREADQRLAKARQRLGALLRQSEGIPKSS
jgi:predicted Ser/Thr protein kinase